jgi:hypothetical protein
MAFEVISSSEIEVGDPLKKELFNKIKNSLDDHESRMNAVETGLSKVVVFNFPITNATSASTFTGLTYFEAAFPFTITACEIRIYEKGSLTGALEIDVKKSTTGMDSADYTSIFTTKPKITLASASDYDRSTNQAFNVSMTTLSAGDTLRLDVTEMPSGGVMGKFKILLYGEV